MLVLKTTRFNRCTLLHIRRLSTPRLFQVDTSCERILSNIPSLSFLHPFHHFLPWQKLCPAGPVGSRVLDGWSRLFSFCIRTNAASCLPQTNSRSHAVMRNKAVTPTTIPKASVSDQQTIPRRMTVTSTIIPKASESDQQSIPRRMIVASTMILKAFTSNQQSLPRRLMTGR